jgi:hypothetical protein
MDLIIKVHHFSFIQSFLIFFLTISSLMGSSLAIHDIETYINIYRVPSKSTSIHIRNALID